LPRLQSTRQALRESLQRYESITATCDHCRHFSTGRICDLYQAAPPEDFQRQPEQCDGWVYDQIPY
jgi:hypothetical protein